MLFRTHVLFGLFVWFVLDLWIFMPAYVLLFVLLGSIFVDIDSSSSKVARKFWVVSWLFRHRGMIHSLLAGFILSAVLGWFSLWTGFGFFVGFLSHLVMDVLTLSGVRVFWPLNVRVRGFVKSGGWAEDVIFVLLLMLDIVFLLYKFL